jgi:hypothetical protein
MAVKSKVRMSVGSTVSGLTMTRSAAESALGRWV